MAPRLRHRTGAAIAAALVLVALILLASPSWCPGASAGAGETSPAAALKPMALQTVELGGVPRELRIDRTRMILGRLQIELADGSWVKLTDCEAGFCALAVKGTPRSESRPKDAIEGSQIATSRGTIRRAYLAGATERAGTMPFGVPLAGRLVAVDDTNRSHVLELGLDRVFEDLSPQIADLDGDGSSEVVTAIRDEAGGGRLAVIGLVDNDPRIIAESAPEGPGRAVLAAAIGDLDGDGTLDIAAVADPAGEGVLTLWHYRDHRLEPGRSLPGFSNLVPGAPVTDLAAAADMDGDGIDDLVLPDRERTRLRVVSLAHGEVAEPGRIALPAPIVTRLLVIPVKGRARPLVVMGLADGKLAIVH
ncbi:MAG: VCBS repeat-containing protein [Hyphomicrobiaceae bacterium]